MKKKNGKNFDELLLESEKIKDKEFVKLCVIRFGITQRDQLIGYSWRMSAHFVASIRNELFGFNYKSPSAEKHEEYKIGGEGEFSERVMKFMESNNVVQFKGYHLI